MENQRNFVGNRSNKLRSILLIETNPFGMHTPGRCVPSCCTIKKDTILLSDKIYWKCMKCYFAKNCMGKD